MIRISEPFHGAVLNGRLGKASKDGLVIEVRGEAPIGHPVTVRAGDGAPARAEASSGRFRAEVTLRDAETDIVASYAGSRGRGEHRIRVVWDRVSFPRYRFSIDDNSFFLRDVAQKGYKSLFDCPYLAILQRLNRKYGTKFLLNLFHATPEGDFTLDRFPAKYRGEWADNAGWLKLSFHARAEFPDRPYQYASAEALAADFDLVEREIRRFAGDASWAIPTVIHWAMCPETSLPMLAARGVKVLSGFFSRAGGYNYTSDGGEADTLCRIYDVNYMLDEDRSEYVSRCHVLKDFASGIVFSRADIVCNNTPPERAAPILEPLTRDPYAAEIMDLFTHEQYFWPFYFNYRPDHEARCEAAIRFCSEHGYKPVFFHEGFLGA